jgi:hypothetical protein
MLKICRDVLCLFIIVLVTVVLAGCGKASPEPAVSPLSPADPTPTNPPTAASPIATVRHSPIASPQASTPPGDQDAAVLRGMLTLMDPTTFAPEEDGLYLVPIDEAAGGMAVPSLDPETAIQAEVDETDGSFQFSDVKIGLYGLVTVSDSGVQLSVRRLDSGQTVILSIEEDDIGKTVDLGRLRAP